MRILLSCSLLVAASLGPVLATESAIDFNRDIRPILAGNCYDCHGPDEESRKADLRLDERESALSVLGAGGELLSRITSADPKELMPPPKTRRTLSPDQIDLLRRWVAQGAPYQTHWAFVPPVRPPLPSPSVPAASLHPVDLFIGQTLAAQGLEPAPEAPPQILIRRLYLDLTGLPPTPEEADAFAADPTPENYQRLVDQLLASKHYGIRWARQWLDLARYSDTNGYEKDRPRTIWPYRDWVVEALNADLPYDRFTIEQLAGDMLPGATLAQRIATGFHRNTMINEEGGIDPLEYRYYAMVDRAATTGTVWLGLTTGCAQCHTHKYDPITHTDYFQLMALLNNADEVDLDVPTPEIDHQRAQLLAGIESHESAALATLDESTYQTWLLSEREKSVPWTTLAPVEARSNLPRLEVQPDGSVFASGDFTKRDVYTLRFQLPDGAPITALRLEVLPDPRLPAHGPGIGYYEGRRGDFFLSELTARSAGQSFAFSTASHSFGKISVGSGDAQAVNVIDGEGSTGWSTATREGERHHLVLNLAAPLPASSPLEVELLFERHFAAALGRFRFDVTTAPRPAQAFASDAPDFLTAPDADLRRHYLRTAEAFAALQKQTAALRSRLPETPATLVLRERPADHPRPTHLHHRGEYLSPREEVSAGIPSLFPPLPPDQPGNRLSLARWLVSDHNPLAARVAVNRAWQALFGRGLVESAEDFGTQAEAPTHPALLDWLAVELRESGWSLKQLHRLLVTSATYRQSSAISPALLARDPDNKLLARGPRFRLEGETARDAALAASGLLSAKMGGPGVYPPQPGSVTALAYGETAWKPSTGADRFRRSLYTFSKRTAPFAAYAVFDAPTGETCTARRGRSNTPLQALTLLNDPMFLEMAASLAGRVLDEPGPEPSRMIHLFRLCLTRTPEPDEIEPLLAFYQAQLQRFQSAGLDPATFLGQPEATPELAAWTMVARALLNLDEAITKG